MKVKLYFFIAFLSLVTCGFGAAQTAPARMYCLSIKVSHGVNSYGDAITLNYAARPDSADELGPNWYPGHHEIVLPPDFGYNSNLDLWDNTYGYSSFGTIYVNLPVETDANGNRFPDFFEVSRATSVTVPGAFTYWDPYSGAGSGNINAVWTRSAGQKAGTYRMTLNDNDLPPGYWGTMQGTFEIIEYTGTMSYTPATNSVSGTITLAQTGASANTFQGPIQFVKDPVDWANTLTNLPGAWLNGLAQTCVFTNGYFFRNPSYPTNYAGYIAFDDDLDETYTIYAYATWVLSINDTHDLDGDGIPDFSDIPSAAPPPRRPTISLARTSTNLLFTIRGDINHLHVIQQVPAITSTNWQPVVSVTLTNDPQVVPVAFPAGSTFYRVRAQ